MLNAPHKNNTTTTVVTSTGHLPLSGRTVATLVLNKQTLVADTAQQQAAHSFCARRCVLCESGAFITPNNTRSIPQAFDCGVRQCLHVCLRYVCPRVTHSSVVWCWITIESTASCALSIITTMIDWGIIYPFIFGTSYSSTEAWHWQFCSYVGLLHYYFEKIKRKLWYWSIIFRIWFKLIQIMGTKIISFLFFLFMHTWYFRFFR